MLRFVLTLANSIIGVSILAMPFCFKQCGVVLATLMLLLSGVVVKVTCHLLLKSAILARRRNYELLAFQTFGSGGKLAVEVSMIGFLLGTCTAFFVVMGDLAPPIVASLANVEATANLRMVILIGLGLFVALPLALLRNVESLAGICTASIGFYCVVLLHIVIASWPSLIEGSWTSSVNYWRPAGVFQCLPIFCMALSCQPQVFEIYDALSDPSVNVMNDVIRGAVNLCSGCYIVVGIFGYIAFCGTTEVGGNILTSFPQTMVVQTIKLGFVLSVAVSFPLVIFPCRTSIHSLVFRKGSVPPTELVSNYIPPDRFNGITVCVILLTLTLGVMIPDIEFVLGMVGSTIGCAICIIFPSLIFLRLTSKNTTERLASQAVLAVGLAVMVLGTYVNLYEANRGPDKEYLNPAEEQIPAHRFGNPPVAAAPPVNIALEASTVAPNLAINASLAKLPSNAKDDPSQAPLSGDEGDGKRQEPVEPKPPKDSDQGEEKVATKEPAKDVGDEKGVTKVDELAVTKAAGGNKTEQLKEREKNLQMREEKADKLIEELEKQKDEQKQIIEEQKEVLQQLKDVAADKQEGEVEEDKDREEQQQQVPLVAENRSVPVQIEVHDPGGALGDQQQAPPVQAQNAQPPPSPLQNQQPVQNMQPVQPPVQQQPIVQQQRQPEQVFVQQQPAQQPVQQQPVVQQQHPERVFVQHQPVQQPMQHQQQVMPAQNQPHVQVQQQLPQQEQLQQQVLPQDQVQQQLPQQVQQPVAPPAPQGPPPVHIIQAGPAPAPARPVHRRPAPAPPPPPPVGRSNVLPHREKSALKEARPPPPPLSNSPTRETGDHGVVGGRPTRGIASREQAAKQRHLHHERLDPGGERLPGRDLKNFDGDRGRHKREVIEGEDVGDCDGCEEIPVAAAARGLRALQQVQED